MPDSEDRLSALYRASRARLQPPPGADAAIIEAAHRAVRARRRQHYPAFALAASVMLAVGLAWIQLASVPDESAPTQFAPAPPATPSTLTGPPPAADAAATQRAKRFESPMSPATQSAPAGRGDGAVTPEVAADAPTGGSEAPAAVERNTDTAIGNCGLDALPTDAEAWRQRIEQARHSGDEALVRCLRAARAASRPDASAIPRD
jgi:hypothetical protein